MQKFIPRNIISFLIVILFVCSFSTHSYAREKLPSQTEKNFLWSVKTENTTVYLLGSIHMLNKESYPLSEEIEKAYNDSKVLVFETDLDVVNNPDTQTKILSLGVYPLGTSLKQNISPDTYKLLENRVSSYGLPFAQFNNFKPWLCALTIAAVELQRLGLNPDYGVDKYFMTKAKNDGKKIKFLETVDFQLNLFAKMKDKEQEIFLLQTLREFDILNDMFYELVESWKNGDSGKMAGIMQLTFKDYPQMYNRLFVQRNKNWSEQIEKMINEQENVMVVVGSGHLVGKDNIKHLLEKKGYRVEQH